MIEYDPDDHYWPRLREALRPYDQFGRDGRKALLADLLRSIEREGSVDMELAHVAANAGIHLHTGRLSREQAIFKENRRRIGQPIAFDPDGNERVDEWPSRGVTLDEAEASDAAIRTVLP